MVAPSGTKEEGGVEERAAPVDLQDHLEDADNSAQGVVPFAIFGGVTPDDNRFNIFVFVFVFSIIFVPSASLPSSVLPRGGSAATRR